ncbi:acetolactate synthase small subunit [Physcia stellaris]|nr:acetolactate synthase small subunit [Physcia stellaris]
MDLLLGNYTSSEETTVYTPKLMEGVVVPPPFPGHTFDDLIRNFFLADVHFGLPSPFAEPDSPEAQPRISAVVKALVGLPKEMNFPIGVGRVRANADVFYKKRKLGDLDLSKWQAANSTLVEAHGEVPNGLAVQSVVEDAPLQITDDDVFADLVEALIFGGRHLVLGVKAKVDVETEVALGKFVIRDIPAEGKAFNGVAISGGNLTGFSPQVGSLEILETTVSSILLQAKINITNPTEYSATVPYVNIQMLNNGSVLGHGTAQNVSVVPGPNHNILVKALWEPDGKNGRAVGRELLSQYVSGYNTTITLRTTNETIPSQPRLGEALSSLSIEMPTPRLTPPKNPNHPDDPTEDPGDDAPHFIDDATPVEKAIPGSGKQTSAITPATMLSLPSPLPPPQNPLTLTPSLPPHSSTSSPPPQPSPSSPPPAHRPLHHLHRRNSLLQPHPPHRSRRLRPPLQSPPGASTSPYLPVDWTLDGVGFEAVKKALGGDLKLDAEAEVGIRVGAWEERIWFRGRGLGLLLGFEVGDV